MIIEFVCTNCGTILEETRHLYECPGCGRIFKQAQIQGDTYNEEDEEARQERLEDNNV